MVADRCLIGPDRDARDCDPTGNELRPTKSWTRASPPRMFGTMHESDNTEEQTHENRNHRRGPHRRHAGGWTDGAPRPGARGQLPRAGIAWVAGPRDGRARGGR